MPVSIVASTNWKRLLLALLLALCLGMMVAACGGGASDSSTADPPSAPPPPPPPPPPPASSGDITVVNHIIIMMQENRSFDSYFGKLGPYREANGYGKATDIDGLSDAASNVADDGTVVTAFHLRTSCIENALPDWTPGRRQYNFKDPTSNQFLGDGYVRTAQSTARGFGSVPGGRDLPAAGGLEVRPEETTNYYLFGDKSGTALAVVNVEVVGAEVPPAAPSINPPPGVMFSADKKQIQQGETVRLSWHAPGASEVMISHWFDQKGRRVMGFYDHTDLPYYYFMASNFATSDRFFAAIPSDSDPNRVAMLAATTRGRVHEPGSFDSNRTKNIFQLLEQAGITWKVYYQRKVNKQPVARLMRFQPFASEHADKIVPMNPTYFDDLKNGTLPQVTFIEELPGFDEHPGGTNPGNIHGAIHIQIGASFAKNIIDSFVASQYWKDSVFFWFFDEGGGTYDHVAAQSAVPPDGIKPVDLRSDEPRGDFDRTGYRVPMMVISPFVKKSYVSHTVADGTAILKFIQTRFKLPHLTARDAAQIDMTEFFDFANPPWMTPPSPPAQPINMPCDYTNLK
jgi:phospholipase C